MAVTYTGEDLKDILKKIAYILDPEVGEIKTPEEEEAEEDD